MSRTIILLLFVCLLNSVTVGAVNSIELRATSFFRDIIFGTIVSVENIRKNIDRGQPREKQQNP